MKDKLLLVGAGGLGRVTLEHAMEKYQCHFVDDSYPVGMEICGAPVVGAIADLPALRKEYQLLVVTIGNNALREKLYAQVDALDYEFPNILARTAYVSPFAQLGWGCILLNNAVVQNGVQVGNGSILNVGAEAHHDCTIDDFTLIYTNSVIRTGVTVGKRAKIGSTVTVSNFAAVPEDAVVPDGFVVTPEEEKFETNQ